MSGRLLRKSDEYWIGQSPVEWKEIFARRVFSQARLPKQQLDEQLTASQRYGVIPQKIFMEKQGHKVALATKGTDGFKHVDKGDFVISLRSFQGGVEICHYSGCVSPAYVVLRLNEGERVFFQYLLKCDAFIARFQSLTDGLRDGKMVSYDQFGGIKLPFPEIYEQRQIAAYLNRETAKIDKLIAKQQKLIKLLKEKRQAVINQAVTKGLNPNVKMRDSGVEWLGEIPEHWTQLSIRHMTKILRGKFTHRPRNDPAFYDGDFPFIQTGDITKADKYITTYKQTLNEKGASVSKEFPAGTLVMAIAANIGDVGIINFSAYFPDSIVGLVPKDRTNIDFLFYLMQALKPSLIQNATVSTQMNLNADQIARILVACPPIHEQIKIVEFIETSLSLFDRLLEKTRSGLELLKEHRQALITAAVTGKIDVRGLITDDEVAALDAETMIEDEAENSESDVPEDSDVAESLDL